MPLRTLGVAGAFVSIGLGYLGLSKNPQKSVISALMIAAVMAIGITLAFFEGFNEMDQRIVSMVNEGFTDLPTGHVESPDGRASTEIPEFYSLGRDEYGSRMHLALNPMHYPEVLENPRDYAVTDEQRLGSSI